MSFENAAVHAARPIAGGRGKDTGINEMFKAKAVRPDTANPVGASLLAKIVNDNAINQSNAAWPWRHQQRHITVRLT
jgi:hypothetical protein